MLSWDGILVGVIVTAAIAWFVRFARRSFAGDASCGTCAKCGPAESVRPTEKLFNISVDKVLPQHAPTKGDRR